MPAIGAILLAVVLFTANAAWCQSNMPTFRPINGWGSVESVPVKPIKIGVRHVIEAGVRMALAHEPFNSIWPNYAYKIDSVSDNLKSTCQILNRMPERLRQNTVILKSNVDLGNADLNNEFRGFGLRALEVCNSNEREPFDRVWPGYVYKIDPASDNLKSINQFLDETQFAWDPMILGSDSDFSNADFSTEFQRLKLDDLEKNLDEKHIFLVIDATENPVPSLELAAQVWQLGEQASYNYIVTENPVPSLELAARVRLGEQASYNYTTAMKPEEPFIREFILEYCQC